MSVEGDGGSVSSEEDSGSECAGSAEDAHAYGEGEDSEGDLGRKSGRSAEAC